MLAELRQLNHCVTAHPDKEMINSSQRTEDVSFDLFTTTPLGR